ncbi:alpha-2-macroglobulin family protein [Halomonas cupida]|uniref:alpha-2-macroglobulin family protein n=1 Tax=Halomonas cupida TaxID=44933 RepID=UPI0039B683E6
MSRLLFCLLVLLLPWMAQAADHDAILPAQRIEYQDGVDLPGNDLRAIFQTDLEYCASACRNEASCRAFTFNGRADACFLKSDAATPVNHIGALSGRMVATDPALRNHAAGQPLGFFNQGEQDQARALYEHLELVQGSWNYLDEAVRGNQPGAWLALMRRAQHSDGRPKFLDRWGYAEPAFLINAWLRADEHSEQLPVLEKIVEQLEEDPDRGPDILAAHRLLAELSGNRQRLEKALLTFGPRVMDTRAEAESSAPRFCAEFSEPLREDGFLYGDYVRANDGVRTNGVDVDVSAEGKRLCIAGLEHGGEYHIVLRQGLPAASGEVMAREQSFELVMPDRSPSVRFSGRGYVLPQGRNHQIPITAVNTEHVELSIYHVGDRGLTGLLRGGEWLNPLDRYNASALASEEGSLVWEGDARVASELNQDTVSLLDIDTALEVLEPGIYAITARVPEDNSYQSATQWFLVSDTSLTTFSGPDGLHVFVNRFSDGSVLADGEVQLIARNNQVLHRVEVNDQGYAHIAPQWLSGRGGDRPALLTAINAGETDFNFINLRDAGFDLSDRGVAGHPAPQTVNVFATTERGIYRPGASVFATVLVRDIESRAIPDMPLTMIALRPDGKEHSRQTLNDQGAGGRVGQLGLDTSAMHGLWRLRFHADPDAEALGEVSFLVEDFVPERVDFDLTSRQQQVSHTEPTEVEVNARYLYGAPGANLTISGKVTRRPVAELSDYPGYRFGIPAGEDQSASALLSAGLTTDDEGQALVTLPVPPSTAAGQVEALTLNMQIREGSGRPVERELSLPMALDGVVIGLKPMFDRVVAEGSDAAFELVALGEGRTAQSLDEVEWTLSRISRDYQWYKVNGEWGYSAVERRSRDGHGTVAIDGEDGGRLSVPVDWGQYELELRTEVDGQPVVTRHSFWAGYYGSGGSADTPDRLNTGLDQASYQTGDELKLRLDARRSGIAEVRVLNGQLVETHHFEVDSGANELSLTVGDDWGAGAWVITSLVTPQEQADDLNPRRAIGVNWVAVDASQRTIDLAMAPAEPLKSRQDNQLRLSVEDAVEGESVYATVAVVDLGILNLTGFAVPQPEEEFFGQRRLAFEMRDLYGRLIENIPGATAALREGGDSNTPDEAPGPRREEYVTVFSGLVEVDADGEALIDLPLPAFNGTVRAMATAWSETGLGNLSEDFIVRDPVVLTAHAPSFLAPGDQAEVRVELAHAEGPVGETEVRLEGVGPVSVAGNGAQTVTLDEGEHQMLTFELTALDPGEADLTLTLETPGGEMLTQTLPLAVRYNDLPIQRRQQFPVQVGAELELPDSFVEGMAEDAALTISFGGLADFHVPAVARSLYAMAWGCTEQLISSVEPLMSARQVLPDEARDKAAERLDEVLAGVLSRQSPTGAFGDWAPESNNFWLDAYASEFLWRAAEDGLDVSPAALDLAMGNLQNKVNGASYSAESRSSAAYALYVLALAGEARASDLRYFADSWLDTDGDEQRNGLEGAWLGAALNEMGDPARASRLFQTAFEVLEAESVAPYSRDYDPYASDVRDQLIAYRLALSADYPVARERVLDAIQAAADSGNSVEQASLLRVAAGQQQTPGEASANLSLSLADYLHSRSVALNPLEEDTTAAVTLSGSPTGDIAPRSSGIEISRRYYSLEGERIDVSELELNQRMLVVLTITPLATSRGQLAIEDPLPAGFQIDNPNVLSSADAEGLEWFSGGIKPTHAEFATDHFLAAVDLRDSEPFELAYMVRAIRPGDFRHPAARVQDMYLPHLQANTDSGRVVIGGADEGQQ